MKIREIEAYFQSLYPKERACTWDNDGLLVCPDRDRTVTGIVTCLDVTFSVIEKAVSEHCELIVSHHPLIFSPLRRICEDSIVGQKVLMLLQEEISLISLHTRFDGAVGGLNDRFAERLGILPENGAPLLPEEPFIGGMGSLPAKQSPEELAAAVSRALRAPVRLYSAEMDVFRVGYCCGSGKDLVEPCLLRGADAFVGGDIPYHQAQEAVERGMTVIDCGHHASERDAARYFSEALSALNPEFRVFSVYEPLGGDIIDES
ncbi:MAG: Nif3-like dinuclear metal center hexameric protein [Clostridia bacterium]|nr:Nif3-like dinuclear metal center hexameric protein [Clostridia bacterium]